MKLSQKFQDFLLCRWAIHESPTIQHQLRRVTISSMIAIFGLLMLFFLNLQSQAFSIAILNAISIAMIGAVNVGIRFRLSYKLSLLLLTTLYFCFSTAILFLESQLYSAAIWMLLLPVIAILALGRKLGMFFAIAGCILTSCILFDQGLLHLLAHPIDIAFNVRFLVAYIIISLLLTCSEVLRVELETDLRNKNKTLDRLSRTDSLTGLPNRRDILEKIKYEAKRSERTKRTFGIILGDIDSFKSINDQYNHTGGDTVLKAVARALMETIRAQDSVAHWTSEQSTIYGYSSRFGGEEFLILLPETDLLGAKHAAEKLRQKIVKLQVFLSNHPQPIQITMSFGVAVCHGPQEIESAIQQADQMLYRAKDGGRNQVQCAIA